MNQDNNKFVRINAKFMVGDAITYDEMEYLLSFYTQIEKSLHLLGPHFHFAWLEVLDRQMRLERYKESRDIT